MRRFINFLFLLVLFTALFSCNYIDGRDECLNLDDFEKFYYNGNLYSLPSNHSEISSKYSFYGEKHQIGYTIGVYNKVFETYALDTDVEENILFQKNGKYFWLKEGFEFPNLNECNVTKLLIEKLDFEGYIVNEREFVLEDISINDLLIEYNADPNTESFLLSYDNFVTYQMHHIYENGIMLRASDSVAVFNGKIFAKKYEQTVASKVYVVNEMCQLNLYEIITNL